MDADPDPRDINLYHRARLCQLFPAYTLETVGAASIDLIRAAELLNHAELTLREAR